MRAIWWMFLYPCCHLKRCEKCEPLMDVEEVFFLLCGWILITSFFHGFQFNICPSEIFNYYGWHESNYPSSLITFPNSTSGQPNSVRKNRTRLTINETLFWSLKCIHPAAYIIIVFLLLKRCAMLSIIKLLLLQKALKILVVIRKLRLQRNLN